jgi:hypothetical protein
MISFRKNVLFSKDTTTSCADLVFQCIYRGQTYIQGTGYFSVVHTQSISNITYYSKTPFRIFSIIIITNVMTIIEGLWLDYFTVFAQNNGLFMPIISSLAFTVFSENCWLILFVYSIILTERKVISWLKKQTVASIYLRLSTCRAEFLERMLSDAGDKWVNGAQGRILYILWQSDSMPIVELSKRTDWQKTHLQVCLTGWKQLG